MKTFYCMCLILVSSMAIAADIPTDVLGAEKMSKEKCINTRKDACINEKCLTSEERNCQSTCAEGAKQTCNVMSNE